MKKFVVFVWVSLMLLILAACGGQEPEEVPTSAAPAEVPIQAEATDTPAAVQLPSTFCDIVDPSQISLNTMGLAATYQVNCVPETPYDASQPPGPMGLPEHIEINFGTLVPAANTPLDPVIYIIPADAYLAMWDAAGNPGVSNQMTAIKDLIAAKPQSVPTSGNPALPVEEAVGINDVATQGTYVNFGNWDGVRYVGRFEQSPNPVTNENMRYIFQGFAGENDEIFIAMFWPVTTPFLPNSMAGVPQVQIDAVNADPTTYMNQKSEELNALSPADWDPNLNMLDSVLASLQYGSPQTPGPVPTVQLPTPIPQEPYGVVTAAAGVNVRTGPGTAYPIIGTARFGTQGAIIGRSADGQWWVTPVQGAPNNQGWVSVTFVQAFNVENVPVIQAPPPPVPTATPTPLPTPAPQINFWADQTTINQGECTTLRWNVQNIQAVWVYPQGDNYQNWPVTGQGSRQVCPTTTTTYEMRVQLTNGQTEFRQVTITVNQTNPLANTTWALASMNVTGVLIPGTAITVRFGTGNQLSGFGGCNNYNGSYLVSGSSLGVTGISRSMATCGEEIDGQESLYISLLQAAASYQLSGNQLIILNVSGQEILRYNRAG